MNPILVVGGTTGIGAALARQLVGAGSPVHVIGRDPARLAATAAALGCPATPADVLAPDELATAVAGIAATGLAGLAYCVGSIPIKPLGQLTPADFDAAFRLNAVGAAMTVKAAAPGLAPRDGSPPGIVLFSSVAVGQGFANHAAIAAAKGAVEGLTRALAAELAPRIRVNCVAPSLMRTPLAARLTGNEAMARAIAQLHPMQRLGEADDAAAMAAFLLSPAAGWITGQVIGVDGGRGSLRVKG
ncbi:MAG: SDR family oxidoreductase [Alphaproteobacteria bacterium]|nr:SDR family oxidoreductase [Alphaproteobacteria bacterium]